ncbi:hypothetical protein [Aquibacillus rhizosphaerae]|uniref:Restriction endonuclease n=1 Tax=Aquibacillus rhizosphaerae TaxID=3051431 RepID=A0ABT7L6U3_9BACI|nr:hypothetical protein [Aquibacillus sp. LR5S19]MDL4840336.1 hypothetical protein [Aquibacillus sp. LR5S19]
MTNYTVPTHRDINFNEYKGIFEKYKNNNDIREITFQNELVKPFIRGIRNDLDVESCDTKLTTTRHDYLQYCGTYISNGKEKAATPDLVITKKWNWFNRKYSLDYRAVVEVKSPFGKESIYSKGYINYSSDLKCELKRHLSAKINSKVILTDSLKWEFYKRSGGGNELIPIRTIELYNLIDARGHWKWDSVDSFNSLKYYLKDFLGS